MSLKVNFMSMIVSVLVVVVMMVVNVMVIRVMIGLKGTIAHGVGGSVDV